MPTACTGLVVEGLSEVETGPRELLDWIQTCIDDLEAARTRPA